ncbi:phosphate/phosphite/phosphonate ABC transporter substrate-binding protein [Mesorhizobium sp. AD1-1]|uniref:phosphate/phosphite/phosphonate ABC transporter substrate-binding protein n=1 Tax=Mesorhizobium sp. AD1-1 TaxID=2876621 RepID=UPI001CCFBEF3|nr:phosphate/phosphite/phosphonate ABC transporter substrate-binding protein [Mesorhizobium sp. AD1-1]MBZ9716216.1 phosphate/phosphite/phosphonate ABC transporter substrate-binding protein [Mesorhizobium sp. AD1-1]
MTIFKRTIASLMTVGALIAYNAGAQAAEECKNPDSLVFSIIPTEETTQELDIYKPLIDKLKEKTGKSVEFFMPTSYASVIEGMVNGWVQIGVHGPNSYVLAKEKDPALEVFATYTKAKGHFQEEGPGYRAVLVVKTGSKFDSIESLKGSVLGLADPASTSGNLLPRMVFGEKVGVGPDLEKYFSKVVYTGGHDQSALAVEEGRVDAAFVATHRLDNVIDRGLAKPEDYKVLWTSDLIPQDPMVYDGKLCEPLKAQIRDAFLTLNEDPASKPFFDGIHSTKFVAMKDSDYDIIRKFVEAEKAAGK